MELKYLGHSAIELITEKGNILIDPFLAQNPNYTPHNIIDILVTHGHSDHFGSSIELSKQFKAPITTVFELANYSLKKGAIANGISLGGKINFSWGWATFVPAFHSSSTPDGAYAGCATGIIFEINEIRFFHAGDTCLNSEMKVIKEVYKPQIALLPIGGVYTMDIEQAAIAAEWLGVKKVIPIHYNTFPSITADINTLNHMLIKKEIDLIVLEKNQSLSFF